ADDGVTAGCQGAADAAGSAACVEDAGAAREHGVDEAGLAVDVLAVAGHGAEALDVPGGVVGVGLDDLLPAAAGVGHGVLLRGPSHRPTHASDAAPPKVHPYPDPTPSVPIADRSPSPVPIPYRAPPPDGLTRSPHRTVGTRQSVPQ